ncbi:hypothetical protein ACKWRH_02385 [Bradyrhizobium sp. Pa8]|uniref:hypothetical protein n=1 Tax=Bradyrhizobium sp. Pa8 TaxID=3386552 RepID=UPI00403FB21A
MGAVSNMESFSRLLNYLGNVKARITSKIVWIFFQKFLRLRARVRQSRAIFARRGLAADARAVL